MVTNTSTSALKKSNKKKSEQEILLDATFDVLVSLNQIPIASLSPEQRASHQNQHASVYLAMIAIENANFSELTKKAENHLPELMQAVVDTQQKLVGLKKFAEVLDNVSAALGVFASITALLT